MRVNLDVCADLPKLCVLHLLHLGEEQENTLGRVNREREVKLYPRAGNNVCMLQGKHGKHGFD